MNRKIGWDIVTLGRILGLAIIAGAVLVAALDANTASDPFTGETHSKLRGFLSEVVYFASYGGLVLAATEIANSLGLRAAMPARIDWNLPQLIKLFGVAVIVVGTIVTLWELMVLHDHGMKFSDSFRYFLRYEVAYVLWQGGLTIVLAGIAERIGWRSQGEDEEAVAPEAPPLSPPA